MQRTISITRKYQLSPFQSADIGTSFIEVPEELALNQDFVDKLIYLQLVTGDKMYRKYVELDFRLEALGIDQIGKAIALLEQERIKTLAEIKDLMVQKGKKE